MALSRIRRTEGERVTVEMTPWKMRLALLGLLALFLGGIAGAVFASSLRERVLLTGAVPIDELYAEIERHRRSTSTENTAHVAFDTSAGH